jgi:hypothetical protein
MCATADPELVINLYCTKGLSTQWIQTDEEWYGEWYGTFLDEEWYGVFEKNR